MGDLITSLKRVDALVADNFPTLSNRHIEEALDKELVLDSKGKKLKKGMKLSSETVLNYEKLRAHLDLLKKGNGEIKIEIMQEEEGFCVISKPYGVPSHPISLFDKDTVTNWAFYHFKSLAVEFPEVQPTVSPHRLDTDTEGLLVVCKTKKSYEEWRERFKTKQIKKRYLAWVHGLFNTNAVIDVPIAHHTQIKSKMLVVEGEVKFSPPLLTAHSKVSLVRALAEKNISLVEITCTTGVTHQVRVHLAYLGFPLVGDKLYDPSSESRKVKSDHHLLLAYELFCMEKTYSVDKNKFIKLF